MPAPPGPGCPASAPAGTWLSAVPPAGLHHTPPWCPACPSAKRHRCSFHMKCARHTAPQDAPNASERTLDRPHRESETPGCPHRASITAVAKAPLLQHLQDTLRRHHYPRRRAVKMPEKRITPTQWYAQGGLKNLGKPCVKGCGECQATLETVTTPRPAQRPLGGQMNGIGLQGIQLVGE